MGEISEAELRRLGWVGDVVEALGVAAELEARGAGGRGYLVKQLRRRFPGRFVVPELRAEPAPLAVAAAADGAQEEANLRRSVAQMEAFLRCPVVRRGALMPDACPAGGGEVAMPVGGAIEVEGAVIPAAHGPDIGCSVVASFFVTDEPTGRLMDVLQGVTRFGAGGRAEGDSVYHPVLDEGVWGNPFLRGLEGLARMHLADQGDGNHFAFLGRVEVRRELADRLGREGHEEEARALGGRSWHVLVTHHGSRGLGRRVFGRGQEAADKAMRELGAAIPSGMAWLGLESEAGAGYWDALGYVRRWARANHEVIHEGFLRGVGAEAAARIGTEHNAAWRRGGLIYHGKGATPAWRDERGRRALGLVPMNLASPVWLVLGGDRAEYLSFAPHGAGRHLPRRALVRQLLRRGGLAEAMEGQMAGLDVRWYLGQGDVAECPVAYKSPDSVREQVERHQLAEVVAEIEPLGSIMAGRRPRGEDELTPKQVRQMGHRAERRAGRQRLRW